MNPAPFRVTPLDETHDRSVFKSSAAPLDLYFHQQAAQDIRRRITACFVALDAQQNRRPLIEGYYTLASTSVLLADLPPDIGKKLPRQLSVPAVRMERLAVDETIKGQGLGSALLADALERAAQAEIAAFVFVVDANDATAAGFYRHHGFVALPDSPLTLFLPLATVRLAHANA